MASKLLSAINRPDVKKFVRPVPAPPPPSPEPEPEPEDDKDDRRRALGQGRSTFAAVRRQRSVLGDPATVQKKTLLGG